MLDARSLALAPQARLRAATTPILSIYIYIYLLGTRVTLLRTEGGAAQAGLIPRPELHWPRWPILPTSNAHNPIPLIYISLSAHVRCVAMRKHMAATLTAAQMSSRSFLEILSKVYTLMVQMGSTI